MCVFFSIPNRKRVKYPYHANDKLERKERFSLSENCKVYTSRWRPDRTIIATFAEEQATPRSREVWQVFGAQRKTPWVIRSDAVPRSCLPAHSRRERWLVNGAVSLCPRGGREGCDCALVIWTGLRAWWDAECACGQSVQCIKPESLPMTRNSLTRQRLDSL